MTKTIKLKSKSNEGEITVNVDNNIIRTNSNGFIPIMSGAYVETMNPTRVDDWYRIPEGITLQGV